MAREIPVRYRNSTPMFSFARFPVAWQDQQGFGIRALRLGLGGGLGMLAAMLGVTSRGRPDWYRWSLYLAPYAWILAFGNKIEAYQLAAIPAAFAFMQAAGDTELAQLLPVSIALGVGIASPVANG